MKGKLLECVHDLNVLRCCLDSTLSHILNHFSYSCEQSYLLYMANSLSQNYKKTVVSVSLVVFSMLIGIAILFLLMYMTVFMKNFHTKIPAILEIWVTIRKLVHQYHISHKLVWNEILLAVVSCDMCSLKNQYSLKSIYRLFFIGIKRKINIKHLTLFVKCRHTFNTVETHHKGSGCECKKLCPLSKCLTILVNIAFWLIFVLVCYSL